MISKFLYNTQVQDIRRWLSEVDLTTADITGVELDIYSALIKSQFHRPWVPAPIAPLAEPTNLQELIGDHLNGARDEIQYQTSRVDNLYQWVNETTNTITAQVETVEKLATEASNDIQDIVQVVSQDPQFYFWVSDTFNSTSYVDTTATTALIDTDHGMVLLAPESLEIVQDLNIELLSEETVGIPGSNLLIIDKGNAGGPAKEPDPVFEKANSTDFANIFDNDPNTWFEVERNFIPPVQKLTRFGRAFVYNPAGEQLDVKVATGNLDWRAYVQWWNKPSSDTGDDGLGVWLAEFRDIEDPTTVRNQQTVSNSLTTASDDTSAHLAFSLSVGTPRALSYINLVPFQRTGQTLVVDSIKVFSRGQEVELARNVTATPTMTNVSQLNREILRRTGSQTTGGMFPVPTDRDIDKIEIRMSSAPIRVPYGLGHPFAEKLEETRKEQRVVFFSIVSHESTWTRIPYNETPRQVEAKFSQGGILGSLPATLADVLGLGQNLFGKIGQIQNQAQGVNMGVGGLLESLGQTTAAAKWLGGTGVLGSVGSKVLGSIGGAIGGALPVIGGLLAAGSLIQGLFGRTVTTAVVETRKGVDVFDGFRASVGLRSLSVLRVKFSNTSQVQSVKLQFQGPVKKIGLFAEDNIPEQWGPGKWASYFLSVDGENWTEVGKITDVTLDGGLVLSEPVDSVYFRAILRGNPNDLSTSPELKNYALQGLPA